jgi:hypothetical protein
MIQKHYDLIIAWANGAKIEFKEPNGNWSEAFYPSWDINTEYRLLDPYRALKEAAEDPNKEIRCGFNESWSDQNDWEWIFPPGLYEIRDKIRNEVDPYKDLKEAACDPGKEISFLDIDGRWSDWFGDECWAFDFPVDHYRIRDKPKKVKMWQWIYRNTYSKEVYVTSYFRQEASITSGVEVIGPALWTQIEVEA